MYSGCHLISAFMFTRILGHLDKKDLQYLFFYTLNCGISTLIRMALGTFDFLNLELIQFKMVWSKNIL
jgi:hypothetical protein